jgi:tRNA(fMet)-specific endonuclease VapC
VPKFILDTDTCIYWLNGDRQVEKRILAAGMKNVHITVITECELYYGAYKSARVEKNLGVIKLLRTKISTLQTTTEAAPLHGKIKANLERRGQPLDDADLLIACVAMVAQGTLITNNTAHFGRVPGLIVENWVSMGSPMSS